jgi:hypothetical protein
VVEPKKAVLREAEAALVAAAEKLVAKQAQLAEVEAQVGGASCFFGAVLLPNTWFKEDQSFEKCLFGQAFARKERLFARVAAHLC